MAEDFLKNPHSLFDIRGKTAIVNRYRKNPGPLL